MAEKKRNMPAKGNGTGSNHNAKGSSIPPRKAEKRKLADVKPHPKQREHFRDLPDAALNRLAKSILTHGLKHPVEITRDNTIICGHQRVRAAKLNGWTEIDVIVRDDLIGDAAVESELLRDNSERRQLSRHQEVRSLKGEYDLVQALPEGERPEHLQGSLKEVVIGKLKMSPKNSKRYLDLLKTSEPVQHAFDDGLLPLNTAARVAGLSKDAQQQIADQIEAGADPKSTVKPYLAKKTGRSQGIHAFRATTVRRLRELADRVDGRLKEIKSMPAEDGAIVDEVYSVIGKLRKVPRYSPRPMDPQELMRELQNCMQVTG